MPDQHSSIEPKEELWRCPVHGVLEPHKLSRGWGTGEPGEYGTCPVMLDEDSGCGQVLERPPIALSEEGQGEGVKRPAIWELWRGIYSTLAALEAICDELPESPTGGRLRGYIEHGIPESIPIAEQALRDAGLEPDPAAANKTYARGFQVIHLLRREEETGVQDFEAWKQDPEEFMAQLRGGCLTCLDRETVQDSENPVVGTACPDCRTELRDEKDAAERGRDYCKAEMECARQKHVALSGELEQLRSELKHIAENGQVPNPSTDGIHIDVLTWAEGWYLTLSGLSSPAPVVGEAPGEGATLTNALCGIEAANARIASKTGLGRCALDPDDGSLRVDTAGDCLDNIAAQVKEIRRGLRLAFDALAKPDQVRADVLAEVRERLESNEGAKAALRILDPDWPSFVSPMSRADMASLRNARDALHAAADFAFDATSALSKQGDNQGEGEQHGN